MDLVGITEVSGSNQFSYRLTGDPFTPTTGINDRIMRGFSLTLGESALQGVSDDTLASSTTGSWLIRKVTTTVPEPGTFLLLCSGLLGLVLLPPHGFVKTLA